MATGARQDAEAGGAGEMSDAVNHPSHYTGGDIECIDAIKASMTNEAFLGYLKGNIQKYLWRYEKKVAPNIKFTHTRMNVGKF